MPDDYATVLPCFVSVMHKPRAHFNIFIYNFFLSEITYLIHFTILFWNKSIIIELNTTNGIVHGSLNNSLCRELQLKYHNKEKSNYW